MLQVWKAVLSGQRIVLASGSPRRKEILLNQGGVENLEIIPSAFEEDLDKGQFSVVEDYVVATASAKARQVAKQALEQQDTFSATRTTCFSSYHKVESFSHPGTKQFLQDVPPFLVIGADTVVALDGEIYEKPTDKDHAVEMLSCFSGRVHQVYTGVVLLLLRQGAARGSTIDESYAVRTFHEVTNVRMANLSPDVITSYVDTGEFVDKAGGYGIQSFGAQLIAGIDGDYANVMGFPLHKFCVHLSDMLKLRLEQT